MRNATQLRRAAVALVVAAALCFGEGRAAAQARPETVSQLWLDVTDDGTKDTDAGVGRTGDVLELDAPSGVELQDSGVAVLTADATGVTLGVALVTPNIGVATGTSLDLSSWVDAAGGLLVDGTSVIDGSRNVANINNSTGTGNVVFSASPTLTGTINAAALTLSGNLDVGNDTGTGSFVRATNPALNGTAQTTFLIDSDNASAATTTAVTFQLGSTQAWDAALRWSHTDSEFEFIGTDAATLLDVQMADLTAVNAALTGTLTGMTNIVGTGNIVLATSPTLVTPDIGAATGTSLDVTGEVQGDSFAIGATVVIDDARETDFVTGSYSGTLTVGSLSSGGAISGTTGTFTGNLTTTASAAVGIATPSAKLHVVGSDGALPTLDAGGDILIEDTGGSGGLAAISLVADAGGFSGLNFGDTADVNVGNLFYSHSTNSLSMRTNGGAAALTIDSSGLLNLSGSRITLNTATASRAIIYGTGSPESVVTASVGSMFLRTDGGASTTLYVKESGTGNTGWVPK